MKKKYSNLLLTVSLSTTLILGCLSMGSKVFAATDEIDEENIEIGAAQEEISIEILEDLEDQSIFDETDTQTAADDDESSAVIYAEVEYTEGIAIDEASFPDTAFRKYVQNHIDSDENGVLDEAEIRACVEIDCSGLGIANLTGIEIFSNLEKLDCSNNNISSLDISQNTALTQLICYGNKLNSLDTSKNSKVEKIVLLDVPTVDVPVNELSGVRVSWSGSTGADGYYIYRRVKGGTWDRIAMVTGEHTLTYTDQTASSGTTYEYSVGGYFNKGAEIVSGDYDQMGKSILYIATPVISKLDCTNNSIKITWNKVNGAEKYRVYYKTGSGSWKRIDSTASNSYTWTGAKPGTKYSFTVRCVNHDGSLSSNYDNVGKSVQYVATPKITTVKNKSTGIKIDWNPVAGAEKYRIYYKTDSGSWTKIADTTSASYTWEGAADGVNYSFTVRCIGSDTKNFTSGYDKKGQSIIRMAQPNISKISAENSGVKITWSEVTGATAYRVYRKSGSGWKLLKETTGTSCTLDIAAGNTYVYTVKALNGSSTSSYHSGKSFRRLETPKINSVTKTDDGVKISWDKVNGVEKYRVYYKINTGAWTKIADTTSTNYIWTGEIKEKTAYKFTVRCISSDAKIFTSGYDVQGKMLPNYEEQYYAAQVLDKIGWDLWEAFKWSAAMPYERFYDDPVPKGYTKCQWYSLYGFKNYRGNCHVMASTFYHMAILLGYDAHYVFGYVPLARGGVGEHGWVEIDLNGTTYVCDPDFTLYTTVEKGYMFTYGTSGTWRYQDYHREN